jgi:4-amino-4-deoxy-L-arabinose transferase-like glycosyltransferase
MRWSERYRALRAWLGANVRGSTAVAVSIVVLGFALRLKFAAHDTSAPHLDENEVVEQSVAFMGGELSQSFVKYGPLSMYVLAGIYHLIAAARGLSPLEYASRVFLQGGEHYFVARAFAGFTLSVLALVTFFALRRRLSTLPALVASGLVALPVVDVLVNGVRIDVPQAAFQGLVLLALGEVQAGAGRRYWIAAGAAAGLAIASKPLPGLLILPCFPLASWLAARQTRAGEARRALARCTAALLEPGLWLAALACVACAVLGDPALLELRQFVESQRAAVVLHSGALAAGPSIVTSFSALGWPFCAALVASLIAVIVRRDARALLVLVFLIIYVAAFWGRSRHYFLVAAAVAACLLIGHGLAAVSGFVERVGPRTRSWLGVASVLLTLVLAAPALGRLWARYSEPTPGTQARAWIEANIPSGTRLYYVGWRGAGPQLVAQSAGAQATFGDHFGYGRTQYAFLKRAFELGYADYERSGAPRYAIASYHNKPYARRAKKTPRSITDGLLKTARAQKREYIIIAGHDERDVSGLGYTWFDGAVLEKEFGKIAIFRVPASP